MNVTLRAKGVMGRYLGTDPIEIVLPEKAALRDLFEYFHNRLSSRVPDFIWITEEKRFRGPVVVTIGGKVVRDMNSPLEAGMEIQIFKGFVGG